MVRLPARYCMDLAYFAFLSSSCACRVDNWLRSITMFPSRWLISFWIFVIDCLRWLISPLMVIRSPSLFFTSALLARNSRSCSLIFFCTSARLFFRPLMDGVLYSAVFFLDVVFFFLLFALADVLAFLRAVVLAFCASAGKKVNIASKMNIMCFINLVTVTYLRVCSSNPVHPPSCTCFLRWS